MIRQCQANDIDGIYDVINDAAKAYEGVIPPDCYHKPYMPLDELVGEMKQMYFFGWEDEGKLIGIMGIQRVRDVTLIRHAYVAASRWRQGIGAQLLNHLKELCETKRLLVGTWADAYWAVKFYQKHGFWLQTDKDRLLQTYWRIPDRQREVSVVLGIELS